MKLVLVLLFLAATVFAREYVMRDNEKAGFVLNQIISDINTNKNATWTATKNFFADKTWAEIKRMFSNYPQYERMTEEEIRVQKLLAQPNAKIPESFDARLAFPKCLKPIRDQGHCGSCWAVSLAETGSDIFCVVSNATVNVTLSGQDPVSCNWYNQGCNGGILPLAWEYFKLTGLVPDTCFPYVSGDGHVPKCPSTCVDGSSFSSKKYRVKDFHHIGSIILYWQRVQKMQEYLMSHGALQTGFSVYQDFLSYAGGVYRHVSGSFLGGHAVKIVGWGVDKSSGTDVPYWIVANSWSQKWGMNGYFFIERGANTCGFEADAYSGDPLLQ